MTRGPGGTFLSPTPPVIGFLSQRPRPYRISPCGLSFCSHDKLNFCLLGSSCLTQPTPPTGRHRYCDLQGDLLSLEMPPYSIVGSTPHFLHDRYIHEHFTRKEFFHTAEARRPPYRAIRIFLLIHKGPVVSGLVNKNIKLKSYQLNWTCWYTDFKKGLTRLLGLSYSDSLNILSLVLSIPWPRSLGKVIPIREPEELCSGEAPVASYPRTK